MEKVPFTLVMLLVSLRAALRAAALAGRACPALEAFIHALLARALDRAGAAWDLPEDAFEDEDFILVVPTMGSAPYANLVEAGVLPDWIMPGVRNRGMRPAAPAPARRASAMNVRAPPAAPHADPRGNPSAGGCRLTPAVVPS